MSIKQSRAVIAQKLWDKWLKANKVSISQEERRDMSNFVAAMKLTNNASLQENPELSQRELARAVGVSTGGDIMC